jgi:hypothetical protein
MGGAAWASLIKSMGMTWDQVVDALRAVGFTDDLLVSVSTLHFIP